MFSRLYLIIAFIAALLSSIISSSDYECKSLVHIGDSTTLSMMSTLKRDYETAGFKNVIISVGNGRSIAYSKPPDTQNGVQTAQYWKQKLGSGICWVIALGTNDAASTSKPDDPQRIDSIMSVIGNDKVMWVNVWMDSPTRPDYNTQRAIAWNTLLIDKFNKSKRVDIFDWAVAAKANKSWFLYDGIHYNSEGSKRRSELITRAAAALF